MPRSLLSSLSLRFTPRRWPRAALRVLLPSVCALCGGGCDDGVHGGVCALARDALRTVRESAAGAAAHTLVAPAYRSVAPTHTSVAPAHTSVAPAHTSVAPAHTSVAPAQAGA